MKYKLRALVGIVLVISILLSGTVFVSADTADVYEEEVSTAIEGKGSLVYSDSTATANAKNKTVEFAAPRAVRYIGVVVGTHDYARMREIEIYDAYGNKLELSNEAQNNGIKSITAVSYKDKPDYNKDTVYPYYKTDTVFHDSAHQRPADPTVLLDGDGNTHSDYTHAEGWFILNAFIIELDDKTEISKITVYSGMSGSPYYPEAVKIYAADNLNCIFCDYETAKCGQSLIYGDSTTTFCQDKKLSFAPYVSGKYVSVVITAESGQWSGDRMREIELYGSDGNKLTIGNGIKALKLLSSLNGSFADGDTYCTIGGNRVDPQEVLLDGNINQHVDITKVVGYRATFLIELEEKLNISKINIYTGIYCTEDQNIEYKHAVNVYASDSLEHLFDEPLGYAPSNLPYENLDSSELSALNHTNLLKNRTPKVVNWGEDSPLAGNYSAEAFTDGDYKTHKDIHSVQGKNPVIIYDMLCPVELSGAMFASCAFDLQLYSTSYEIYAANTLSELSDAINGDGGYIASLDQTKRSEAELKQIQLYVLEKRITARYIAFYITDLERNAGYNIARIAELGIWGEYAEASLKGDVNCDGDVSIKDIVRLKLITANNLSDIPSSDLNGDGLVNAEDIAELRKILLSGVSEGTDQKPSYTDTKYTVSVDLNKTVNGRFDGIGGNIVPMNLMSGYVQGYNDAYWDAEVSRIIKLKAPIVRMWMQVDWLEQEKDAPNWNSPQMKAIYKYLDAFKAAGVEVQITYNWKVGNSIQDWFSIEGLEKPGESAPRDLDHFARSCYRLIKGLHDRGYTNVKYLTYANEPNLGDFECVNKAEELPYYIKMAQKVSDYFEEMNYRDRIELWGCESSEITEWITECAKNPEIFDALSWHSYAVTSKSVIDTMAKFPATQITKKYLSEFGESAEPRWHRGLAGVAINGSNNGLTGLLNWCLSGTGSMSAEVNVGSWDMNSDNDFWNSFNLNDSTALGYYDNGTWIKPRITEVGRVNRSYYIASMFDNYVARESTVVKSTANNQNMRTAAYIDKQTGDITVAVEFNKNSYNRSFTVDFGKEINKTFYKHVYTDDIECDQNAVVPPAVKVFDNVKAGFTDDDVENEYSVVIYTTKAPVKQIKLNSPITELKAGEKFTFEAEVIDGTGDEEIEWQILTAANHGNSAIGRTGSIASNGKSAVYTAASNAVGADTAANKHEDVISVKAAVKGTDVYSIAIVRIKK